MRPFSVGLYLVFSLLVACRNDSEPPKKLELPLTVQEGYGPFEPGFGFLKGEDIDSAVLRGMPTDWINVERKQIVFDFKQYAFQNFHAGRISAKRYKGFQKGWQEQPDSLTFSKKPIQCSVNTIRGFDVAKGKWAVLIDTNNDYDFSDEKAVYPEVLPGKDPFAYKDFRLVNYQIYQKGKIVNARIPVVVKTFRTDFFYIFPQHTTARLNLAGKEYELAVSEGPAYEKPEIVEIPSGFWAKKPTKEQFVPLNETITLGGVRYKNRGVDLFRNVLRLERADSEQQEYPLQMGYPMKTFKANEFTTDKPISLADYRGKYVYIDFWWTGCLGCMQDMPALKGLYRNLDKSRADFIGLVAYESPKELSEFLLKKGLKWPQVLSDSVNQLVESYQVTGFPTTVLLDPKGVIVAKDLRAKELATKLSQLGLLASSSKNK